jgi:hypothetical protein
MSRTACTEAQCLYSRAIPLFPLWAVRPVQRLSACTVQLYLYSPYEPYGLYRASVPVQYRYTSTAPMGRTACTEPQCLYKGALYLTVVHQSPRTRNCCVRTVLFIPRQKIDNLNTGLLGEVVITLEDGTERLSRNVGKELPLHAS